MTSIATSLLLAQGETLWVESGGSFAPVLIVLIALGLGVLTWFYYRRETRTRKRAARWFLPLLRAVVVTLVILLLLEPVLVRRGQALERGRVLVVLDRSKSMTRRDPGTRLSRKVALAEALGLLSGTNEKTLTEEELERWSASTDVGAQRALATLESLSRWERATRLLFDRDVGVFDDLSWPHISELATAGEGLEVVPLTRVGSAEESRRAVALDRAPDVAYTDIGRVLEEAGRREVHAVVLLSDGRHNRGKSPITMARKLGTRGVAIYPVGMGSADEPLDLGVLDVHVPTTAYEEDRLEGKIVLKLSAPSDLGLRVSITRQSESEQETAAAVLWEHEIDSSTVGASRILELPFILPERTLPQGRPRLVAEVRPIAGEASTRNNRLEFLVTVKKRELRVLLLDGRPRWTWRYLKKLFERDEKVFVNAVMAGLDPDRPLLPRGECDGCFPATDAGLESYDLVVLGDLSPELFRDDERVWIRNFVDAGGGLILVAGSRGHLAHYANGAMAPLLPVRVTESTGRVRAPRRLRLTASGKRAPSLKLVEDPKENAAVWELLRPSRWVQSAKSLPGAEVWVETIAGARGSSRPVLVHKRFGRGNVLYLGIEESWRWRYKIADLYHARFWSQQVDYFREEDFAVRANEWALDTDRATYGPTDVVRIRVQRSKSDGDRGEAATAAVVELWREGAKVRDLSLDAPGSADGVQQALLEGLEPGRYSLRPVPSENEAAPMLPFDVRVRSADEDLFFAWNEDLLARLALQSGGKYLREEHIQRLPELLEKTSAWHDKTARRPLVHGWVILTTLLLLLTVEWLLRKRSGLV